MLFLTNQGSEKPYKMFVMMTIFNVLETANFKLNLFFNFIPETFTVKAHPALFERRGVSQKMRHCYSSLQLTYSFKTHTKHSSLQLTYTFKTHTKHKKLRRLALCAFIFISFTHNPHIPECLHLLIYFQIKFLRRFLYSIYWEHSHRQGPEDFCLQTPGFAPLTKILKFSICEWLGS